MRLVKNILKKIMLIIDSKDCESIDKALKKYKKKFEKTHILSQLRDRKHYTKKSVERRKEILSAIQRQAYLSGAKEA